MSTTTASVATPETTARAWLDAWSAAVTAGDPHSAAELFHPDCYWRDLLAFSWDLRTFEGRDEVAAALKATHAATGLSAVELEPGKLVELPVGEFGTALHVFFTFETTAGTGRGLVRLLPGESGELRAFTLLTMLQDLRGVAENVRRNRPRYASPEPHRSAENWADHRRAASEFTDADPEVVIVGAGQAGLTMAARLGRLGVPALVVDRHPHLGDNWRNRYHSLVLHNETCVNHMPYMPFPDTYPAYIPKDMLADWFEAYARALELNVWSGTEFLGGSFDEEAGRWTVEVRRADGTLRRLRPSHMVQAVGITGSPYVPDLPGHDTYPGPTVHSSAYSQDVDVAGRDVLVVGAGTSAHDVAQDIHLRGGRVTMLQRSSSTIVSLAPSGERVFALYSSGDDIRPLEDTDLMSAAVPYKLLIRMQGPMSHQMAADDAELLDGLRARGFALDNGEDDTGFYPKLLRYFGGYYLNVGASDLIVSGDIAIKQGAGVERFEGAEVVLSDGTRLRPDVVVLATGYRPAQDTVRGLFGDEVAEKVGPVWGLAEDGELRAMWSRTGQPNLFVLGGSFAMCRIYGRLAALQIKAAVSGVIEAPRTRAAREERA